MAERKIAVFPASGSLGSSIYTHLSSLIPAHQIVLISRTPSKLPKTLVDAGVETRQADYNSIDSLQSVFTGISSLCLVSYPSIEIEHRFNAHKAGITAAVESNSGLKHVFYTSLGFAGLDGKASDAHVMQAHLRTEAWLREFVAGHPQVTFTAIREGIYSETYPMYTGFPDLQGSDIEIALPHDGKAPGIAWVSIDNLGEATAKLIAEYLHDPSTQRYSNKIVLLSGPRAWTLGETIDVLSRVAGKKITFRQGSFDEYATNPRVVEALGSHGPGDAARDWTSVFKAISHGETAVVTGEVERLLGRPADDFETIVRASLQSKA